MKKINISSNFLLVEKANVYFDKESAKILCMSEQQILVYDNINEYLNALSNMYEYFKQETKA